MKIFYYCLGGLLILTEFNMLMQLLVGKRELNAPYLCAMAIIGVGCYWCFSKASKNDKNALSNSKILINENDYLVRSNTLERKVLEQDTLLRYKEILDDKTTNDYLRSIVTKVLIPFKVSFLKYGFNTEYYNSILAKSMDVKVISPSLIVIQNDSKFKVRAYPKWFYIGFPDVLKWAVDDGYPKLKSFLEKFNSNDLFDEGHIKTEYLIQVIQLYQSETGSVLETTMVTYTTK